MKRFFYALLASAMLLSAVCLPAAAKESINAVWHTDYSDNKLPKLYVEFTTPAKYTQQVTAVIYPYDKEAVMEEYIRMEEVSVKDEKATLVFNITDSFGAADGKYVLELRGNGHLSEKSKLDETIYVINPAKIASSNGVLANVNDADSSTIYKAMENITNALQFKNMDGGTRAQKRLEAVLKMRSVDFNGAFKTLENVRTAWEASDVIVYTTENPTPDVLKEVIEATKNSTAIDTESADFQKYEDSIYDEIIADGGKSVKCCTDLRNIVYKHIAKNVINDSGQSDMEANVMKYASYIGLSTSYIDEYNDLSTTQCEKIMRQLYNKNFNNTDEILSALKEAIDNPPEKNQQKPSSGGGGGGGGRNYSIAPEIGKTETNQSTGVFTDCDENHWAYRYVKALAEKGIVNGYSDGSFNPSKAVSREEFVKMMICASGMYDKNAVCSFNDVSGDAWMYSYVASAVNNGIINGVSSTQFGVGTAVTREDAAVIGARILKKYGKASENIESNASFSDFESVSDYAKENVSLLSKMKILNGFEDNTYRPKESLSRAEAAKIIFMITENI